LHRWFCERGLQGSEDVQCLVGERATHKTGQIGGGMGHACSEMLEIQSARIIRDEKREKNGRGAHVLWK
jgi:hypothetical protein